jgi:hypothetical protein
MANNSFSAQELCTIIESCAKHKVCKISFASGGEIIFNEQVPLQALTKTTVEQIQMQEKVQEQAILQDELQTRQDQLDLMLIEDAEQYEKLTTQELLSDRGKDGAEA